MVYGNLVPSNFINITPPITQRPISIRPPLLCRLPIDIPVSINQLLLWPKSTRKQHTLDPIIPLAMQNLQNPNLVIIIDRLMLVSILLDHRHTLHYPLKARADRIPFRRRLGSGSWVEGLRALPFL